MNVGITLETYLQNDILRISGDEVGKTDIAATYSRLHICNLLVQGVIRWRFPWFTSRSLSRVATERSLATNEFKA